MEFIRTENLYVKRGGKVILKGVNFVLEKGEKVFIVGPNGSGKTSFAEALMGFVDYEGKNFFKGREVKEEEDFYDLRVRFGYVFQNPDDQLFSPTVEEELAFGPLNLGFSKERIEFLINKVLGMFSVAYLKETPIYKLSGGQKRLVSIAAVLTMEPEGLILDEPTNGLDEKNFGKLVEFLKNTDKTVVVITHDSKLLESLNWKVYKVENGSLLPVK